MCCEVPARVYVKGSLPHENIEPELIFQVTGNSRNYKSTRGKRPCPININERGRQGPEGKQNATIPFNFVPMEPPDAMSSCSEYDSEDNCSLSSNALGEFGGMTLSEIEQLAFNEGFGNLGQS